VPPCSLPAPASSARAKSTCRSRNSRPASTAASRWTTVCWNCSTCASAARNWPGTKATVSLTVDASVAQSFLRHPLAGSLAFSGRLYIDQTRSGVYMAEPRIERFEIKGLDASVQRQLARAANGVMDKVVLDIPVYTFRSEDLRYAGVQYIPTRIATRPGGLRVSLEPAQAQR